MKEGKSALEINIEKDYIECNKVISLQEYKEAKKLAEEYANNLFQNQEELLELLQEDYNLDYIPF